MLICWRLRYDEIKINIDVIVGDFFFSLFRFLLLCPVGSSLLLISFRLYCADGGQVEIIFSSVLRNESKNILHTRSTLLHTDSWRMDASESCINWMLFTVALHVVDKLDKIHRRIVIYFCRTRKVCSTRTDAHTLKHKHEHERGECKMVCKYFPLLVSCGSFVINNNVPATGVLIPTKLTADSQRFRNPLNTSIVECDGESAEQKWWDANNNISMKRSWFTNDTEYFPRDSSIWASVFDQMKFSSGFRLYLYQIRSNSQPYERTVCSFVRTVSSI